VQYLTCYCFVFFVIFAQIKVGYALNWNVLIFDKESLNKTLSGQIINQYTTNTSEYINQSAAEM